MSKYLDDLNPAQKAAVTFGEGPLLIVAGAGTGKTKTLAYRVSYLISQQVSPESILLLTFTRRAAEEMLKRASLVSNLAPILVSRVWGGTFHSVASRLLRIYAESIGLSPSFTILDRSDSEDYLNVIRNELKFSTKDSRFPRKSTCLDIYSRRVNSSEPLRIVIQKNFPWCINWCDDLNLLFGEYARRKQKQNLLDYDDLLLYWFNLLQENELARDMGRRFAHILVDEYQDTNPLQSGILRGLRRENHNISVVGDDAQSIYGFRSASVRNILDFPSQFPGAAIIKLEQNYRSLKPILETTNQVIAQSKERYSKDLWTVRQGGEQPQLITCVDENDQDETVVKKVLEHYEQGILLKHQAVLFRASSHSASLELSLASHNIPFHKYGGLRFLETAHVKDLISFLRIMENPRDEIAWFRVFQLIKGVGPSTAATGYQHILANGGWPASLSTFKSPVSAASDISRLVSLIAKIEVWGQSNPALQVEEISKFYIPLLEANYENPAPRAADIEHLGQIASRYATRQQFLTEMVLDPPAHTGDFSGPPLKDEDYLTLSTIHSAKGLEWDAVYLIHAADGNLPADMATGSEEEIEEELRLTYVAMTRAKDFLYVLWPQRYYHRPNGVSDNHNYAQCSRFFNKEVMATMHCVSPDAGLNIEDSHMADKVRQNIAQRINQMWD